MRRTKEVLSRELQQGEVNIIPIVDVSFVLVIFCLVTMNLILTAGINVLETKAGAASGKAVLKENVSITLTRDGKIFVDQEQVDNDKLVKKLSRMLPTTKDQMVIITADNKNRCEQVVDILDLSRKCGAKRLALMNKTEEE